MNMTFTVHNPHRTQVAQNLEHKGKTVRAALDGFECELMSSDGTSGTLKVRVVGTDEDKAAEALFVVDAAITATFEATAAAASATADQAA